MNTPSRRQFLAILAAGSATSLAGCDRAPPSTRSPTPPRTPGTGTASPEGPPGTTGETPTEPLEVPGDIFTDQTTIRAIQRQVREQRQPWFAAYRRLLEDADEALNAEAMSVVDNGAPHGVDDPNKYGTDAPYQETDGVFSEDANREDYDAALAMGGWIRHLGLAYGLTGEDRYARKAVELLHHWFVDPETRMFPAAKNFGPHTEGYTSQNSIEHYITTPKMLYGASFVHTHDAWSAFPGSPVETFVQWVRDYHSDLVRGGHRGGPEGNGIYKWWLVNRTVAAAYLDDTSALSSCFEDWRTTAFSDFEERGTFKFARWRTRGLYYSFSALTSLVLTAEVARHHGVDLYGHTVDGVNRLRTALEFHAPLIRNPDRWRWKELGGLADFERELGGVAYEVSYSHWQDEAYFRAVKAVGRPVFDQRILGWATLTHGNLFELDE